MSSHHFVKEGQEPALMIIQPLSLELIQPLLEWAPLVVVAETALQDVLNWGIKIDAVLTRNIQPESLREKLLEQGPVEIISFLSDEEMLHTGIDFVMARKHQGVNIIMDATAITFDQVSTMARDFFVSLITQNMKWSVVSAEFKKWFPEETVLKIKCTNNAGMFFTGVKEREPGTLVTEKDGSITIKSERPFWIGEILI